MRRRIATIALAVTALTVGPATVAEAKPVTPSSTAPSFCFDLLGLKGLCIPALL